LSFEFLIFQLPKAVCCHGPSAKNQVRILENTGEALVVCLPKAAIFSNRLDLAGAHGDKDFRRTGFPCSQKKTAGLEDRPHSFRHNTG
jgi:hypothetical protein